MNETLFSGKHDQTPCLLLVYATKRKRQGWRGPASMYLFPLEFSCEKKRECVQNDTGGVLRRRAPYFVLYSFWTLAKNMDS